MAEEQKTDVNAVITKIIARKVDKKRIIESLKQYEPKDHDIMNARKRKNKFVNTDDGVSEVKVARIPIALQKIIVSRAASFLIGKPIMITAPLDKDKTTDERLLKMVQKTWDDNKLNFKSKKIAKIMMSETECAEIWYSEDVDKDYWGDLGKSDGTSLEKMRMKIAHPKAGDTLYPNFDMMGNLVSFGRGYFVTGENNQKIERFDLYTEEFIYYTANVQGVWTPIVDTDNPGGIGVYENTMGKIPVIYYNQEQPEWADVQPAIERLETVLSNFADTNDYFGSPMVLVSGEVVGFAKKGEQGKVLTLKNGAKAEYLTWDGAPEAIKLEIETLFDIIYSMTQTPNITFKEMKGIGPISGVALDTFFIDAQLKARDKQEDTFGECTQRRTNFLKATCLIINDELVPSKDLAITNQFGAFKIDNTTEEINNLITATGGKAIMSRQTAMELNPLIIDKEQELERMEEEAKQRADENLIE